MKVNYGFRENFKERSVKILNIRSSSPREIRVRYLSLARKHHLDKWSEGHAFSKAQGENDFKNISNAFNLLKGKFDFCV